MMKTLTPPELKLRWDSHWDDGWATANAPDGGCYECIQRVDTRLWLILYTPPGGTAEVLHRAAYNAYAFCKEHNKVLHGVV
jgi:hypothetical protein